MQDKVFYFEGREDGVIRTKGYVFSPSKEEAEETLKKDNKSIDKLTFIVRETKIIYI